MTVKQIVDNAIRVIKTLPTIEEIINNLEEIFKGRINE